MVRPLILSPPCPAPTGTARAPRYRRRAAGAATRIRPSRASSRPGSVRRARRFGGVDRRGPVGRRHHVVPLELQRYLQQFTDIVLVVDDQHPPSRPRLYDDPRRSAPPCRSHHSVPLFPSVHPPSSYPMRMLGDPCVRLDTSCQHPVNPRGRSSVMPAARQRQLRRRRGSANYAGSARQTGGAATATSISTT